MFKILVQFEIFPMLKRPSEMENVPPKIIQRDKLTLNSQILTSLYVFLRLVVGEDKTDLVL